MLHFDDYNYLFNKQRSLIIIMCVWLSFVRGAWLHGSSETIETEWSEYCISATLLLLLFVPLIIEIFRNLFDFKIRCMRTRSFECEGRYSDCESFC